MAAATRSPIDARTDRLIRAAILWHSLATIAGLAIAVLAGIGMVLANVPVWLRIILTVLAAGYGIANGLAALHLNRRKLSGRTFSLVTNFLAFLAAFLYSLHILGIFTGIDQLAAVFGRGLWPLAGVLVGYLVSALGDSFHHKIQVEERLKKISKWIISASLIIFAVVVLIPNFPSWFLTTFLKPLPLILLALQGVLVFVISAIWREPTANALHANNSHVESLDGYLFLAPNLLGFLLFFAGPLIFSLYISFTNWDAFGNADWVGLSNYIRIFTLDIKPLTSATQVVTEALDTTKFDELARFNFFGQWFILGAADKLFWLAMRNTLVFCLLAVPLSVIPALLLSNILNSKIPGMKFFRAIYFIPSIAATVGVALIWQWLYNSSVGYINYVITSAVNFVNSSFGAQWIDPQIRWLSDTTTALLSIIIMSAWQTMGFNTVLFLAGLQNIPKELYEAATVDGAGRWHKFWSLTLPLLAPTTFFVVTTTTIQALQVFEQVFVMTNPPGGPNNSTLTLVLYLYQSGFQSFRQGYGSAVAWVLFLIIFGVTLAQFRRQRGTMAYDV